MFDAPGPTFRDELDAEYKAGRKETPDLFVPQIPLIHEVVDTLQIPTLEVEGVEADDVIAHARRRVPRSRGTDVIIVTGDRDATSSCRTRTSRCSTTGAASPTTCCTTRRASSSAPASPPQQYPEYAALRGDPSDNLPGVPGIGEKTAAKLVHDLRRRSRRSSSTSTSSRRSSARTSATLASACS